MDPQEYLLHRLDETAELAGAAGDEITAEEAHAARATVFRHSPKHGVVVGYTAEVCEVCEARYPCAVVKANAVRFRDRDDFPKHLL